MLAAAEVVVIHRPNGSCSTTWTRSDPLQAHLTIGRTTVSREFWRCGPEGGGTPGSGTSSTSRTRCVRPRRHDCPYQEDCSAPQNPGHCSGECPPSTHIPYANAAAMGQTRVVLCSFPIWTRNKGGDKSAGAVSSICYRFKRPAGYFSDGLQGGIRWHAARDHARETPDEAARDPSVCKAILWTHFSLYMDRLER